MKVLADGHEAMRRRGEEIRVRLGQTVERSRRAVARSHELLEQLYELRRVREEQRKRTPR